MSGDFRTSQINAAACSCGLDPIAHSIGIVVLAIVGIAAAWIPARRAATIDPVVALRKET